ncbi:cation-translocating P-type ATPase [Ruegeria arenilitoris]|uniref:cation-translocating P-type ATPase n=1 Tax=Ruegeria arenilitoris TaxID=1173585 RepID=UPI001481A033|nr:cation-transporting P-type ATPase [Ruegeria arenilitoris]
MNLDPRTRGQVHAQDSAGALALLEVDLERGLSAEEAARRQKIYGENQLERAKRTTVLTLLLDQFRSVIVWLLTAAAVLSMMVSDYPEAIAIFCVLAINTAIGFFTSWKALRSMEALFQLTAFTTRVRRDGESVLLQVAKVTPGDVVILEAGDVVPADLRLIKVENLQCNESALTGESAPVTKTSQRLVPDTLVADRTNIAFKGTAVTRGAGIGVVALVGAETEIGRIATLAQTAEAAANPLEKRLDKLGQALVLITIVLSGLIGLIGFMRGLGMVAMTETAIALAVAAVPEGLPVVATLALARGMLRMARRNTLIERLSAVETLGATTMILTDKTGTLTENQMTVAGFLLEDRDLTTENLVRNVADAPDLRMALEIGALCNTAELTHSGQDGIGDPLELALLDVAALLGVRPDLDPDDRPEVGKHPYDPAFKMMATQHSAEGRYFVAVKGAPEAVLESSIAVLTATGPQPLTEAQRQQWLDRIEAAAGAGYRLIGLAYKYSDSVEEPLLEQPTFVGLVKLLDPLRPDVPAAIAECLSAGVRVVMMTGDHIATATEIAAQAGLGVDGRIVAMSEQSLQELKKGKVGKVLCRQLAETNVFARVAPETKLRLVEYYQNQGHVVAMTGDGVNDAPALKKSDIGIAMGQRGTQVARDAADVVLKDDAFASIVAAMWQGRVIFGNIRRFVVYLMSCNFSEILIVGLAIAAGLPAPLVPLQILFLNIVTDVFPAFALGLGEGDRNVMKRPPRDPQDPIVGRPQWIDIAVFGLLITVATLGAYWLALIHLALPVHEAVTVAFLTLALGQLWHVFNMRERGEGLLINSVSKNPWVFSALLLCLALLTAAFQLPSVAGVLQLSSLSFEEFVLAAGTSLFPLIGGSLWLKLTRALGI